MVARFFDLQALGRDVMAVARERGRSLRACLVIVEVGDEARSSLYVARKIEDCEAAGIRVRRVVCSAEVTQVALVAEVEALNRDGNVTAILVQRPLPGHLDAEAVQLAISPGKDVDGLHPVNMMSLVTARPLVVPPTVRGIVHVLEAHGIETQGRSVAVIGRGILVGRPLGMVLSGVRYNGDVTVLHRGSVSVGDVVRRSDIVIGAAGVAHLVTAEMVKPGAVVIDVGMSWPDGALCGDVHPDVASAAAWMTPPDRSFGVMTRMMLVMSVLDLAERQAASFAGRMLA